MKEAIEEKLNQEAVAPFRHRSQRFYRWSKKISIMTKQEYEELRSTIEYVGKSYNSIEEFTQVRDHVEQVEASNNIAMLESPVKLAISLRGPCSAAEEYITPYLDAETTLYIKNAILRRLNSRIAFFKKEIEDINYTKRKTKKK